jgi:hypothetical protein
MLLKLAYFWTGVVKEGKVGNCPGPRMSRDHVILAPKVTIKIKEFYLHMHAAVMLCVQIYMQNCCCWAYIPVCL